MLLGGVSNALGYVTAFSKYALAPYMLVKKLSLVLNLVEDPYKCPLSIYVFELLKLQQQ